MVERIISGGQTGADRGGLDAAIALGLHFGGYAPWMWRAEDGKVPDRYREYMDMSASSNYGKRTKKNIDGADATVIFLDNAKEGNHGKGTKLTLQLVDKARADGKHFCTVDMDLTQPISPRGVELFRQWADDKGVRTLNVAGPRESRSPGTQGWVSLFLQRALRRSDPAESP